MTEQIRTLIIDDEPLARKGLEFRLAEKPLLKIVGQASNGRDALSKIEQLQPDLLFLDIQMPLMNGFQLLQQLQQQQMALPMVVFTTAYDQYAMQAFDVHAIDYLLKPIDEQRLSAALDKVQRLYNQKKQQQNQHELVHFISQFTGNDSDEILRRLAQGESLHNKRYLDAITIKEGSEIISLNTQMIRWIDAAGDYMCIHSTDDNTHILRKTMKQLENQLDPGLFVRVHRSVIVNRLMVEKLVSQSNGEYLLILDNGHELKVSRSYKERAKAIVNLA